MADGIDGYGRGKRQEADYERDSAWVLRISGLTWDGGRLDLSRDTKCSGVDGYRKHLIPCAVDHEPYTVGAQCAEILLQINEEGYMGQYQHTWNVPNSAAYGHQEPADLFPVYAFIFLFQLIVLSFSPFCLLFTVPKLWQALLRPRTCSLLTEECDGVQIFVAGSFDDSMDSRMTGSHEARAC